MEASVLIDRCENLIDSFAPDRESPSTHLELFLQLCPDLDDNAAQWLEEVFLGTLRYEKMLSLVVDGLYARHSGEVLRNDRTLYTIFSYLLLVRLDDLGFEAVRDVAMGQSSHKMLVLWEFLFLDSAARSWMEEQLLLLYDPRYVQDELMQRLDRYKEAVKPFLDRLRQSVVGSPTNKAAGSDGSGKQIRSPKLLTVPEPFNLTIPKAKAATPVLTTAPSLYKALPVPDHLNSTSLVELEQKHEQRRQAIRATVVEKHKAARPPLLKSGTRARKVGPLQEEPQLFHAQPAPDFKALSEDPVRLTAAAVLREEARYRKKQAEQADILRRYETELKDSRDFDTWKLEMMELDDQRRAELIRTRKEEMARAQEEAAEAMRQLVKENHEAAQIMKKTAEELQLEKKEAEAKQLEEARQKVEVLQLQREQVREAVQEIAEKKAKQARDIELLKEKMRKERQQEKERDLRDRQALIKKIQVLEELANARAKRRAVFDPTESANLGLMAEMSMVELKERLQHLQLKEEEELKRKRDAIMVDKAHQQDKLEAKLRTVRKLRAVSAVEHSAKREKQLAEREETAKIAVSKHQEQTLAVYDKISAKKTKKREEALELARQVKERKLEQLFLKAGKAAVEEQKWKTVMLGAERHARQRQETSQAEGLLQDETLTKVRQQRVQNRQQSAEDKQRALSEYDARLATLHDQYQHEAAAVATTKRQRAAAIHAHEREASPLH